jgi:hypothetical protein
MTAMMKVKGVKNFLIAGFAIGTPFRSVRAEPLSVRAAVGRRD